MKFNKVFLLGCFFIVIFSSPGFPKDGRLPSEFLKYEGKYFKGVEDPEFQRYEIALRDYLANHLKKHYGIEVEPKTLSSFDLLEIEALVKCKKKEESIDSILKLFPRSKLPR